MPQGPQTSRSTGFHACIESTTQLGTTIGSNAMTRPQPLESSIIHPIPYRDRHMLTFITFAESDGTTVLNSGAGPSRTTTIHMDLT